jgi:hypothetical protein
MLYIEIISKAQDIDVKANFTLLGYLLQVSIARSSTLLWTLLMDTSR